MFSLPSWFGTPLAPLAVIMVIAALTSLPDTLSLLITGSVLIFSGVLLRRVLLTFQSRLGLSADRELHTRDGI